MRLLTVVAAAACAGPSPAADPLAGVKAVPGFDVTLFAAPPDVAYPTCLAAAPDGTLFVGSDLNGSLGAKPGKGRVVRCRDTDGDGKADAFTTFCEVDSPRGLWWDGDKTLYVLHPPFITAYTDDDGDGKADHSDHVVTGLGFDLKFRGADHTTNGFRYAIDGFFYVAVGDYGAMKAQGKDGRTVQLRGGGVVRVRPDGTGLEVVADGLRNVYDVAVSPTLDLFTRDNTNDGGGWDVRLSHVHPTAHYGYPSLFRNFPREIVQPLADYGGGSPTGALFLDEPGYPAGFGTALYTCEWGRSAVYRHPLTPNGATFKVGQEKFLDVPRPTDMDADARGVLYVSSWKDGGFDFSTPTVGYVLRVTPKGWTPRPVPDFKKATDAELLTHLASPSGTLRVYAQREMLRRASKPETVAGLEKLATGNGPVAGRVAAVFTLKRLLGSESRPALVRLAGNPDVLEFALRALSDDPPARDAAGLFENNLSYFDDRVRAQAVIGVGRLADPKDLDFDKLLDRTGDADPVVAHLAVTALVKLGAAEACLSALNGTSGARVVGGLRALQSFYRPDVVARLIEKLDTSDPLYRPRIIATLARLYYQEAPWDGRWWGTRPDTTGPYFKPVTWAESDKIAAVLKRELAKADADALKWLLPELVRHRIEFPEVMTALVALAGKDAAVRKLVVDVMAARPTPPTEVVPVLAAAAADAKEAPGLRAAALRGLAKLPTLPAARDALLGVLTAPETPSKEIDGVWVEFARDGKRTGELAFYTKLADDPSPGRRELAYGVVASIADRNLGDATARKAAEGVVAVAWAKPDAAAALVRAVTRLGLTSFAPQLRKLAAGPDATLAAAATGAMTALKLDPKAVNRPLVGGLKFEDVMAQAEREKGDAALGAKLFGRTGCANCHTVAASEPLKGPLLAGVRAKYSRAEVLESILKPSNKIAQGFETYTFQTADGKTLTGFVVREGGQEVEVRDGTGATTVLKKDDIESRRANTQSVMPEKLVDDLTVAELAALIAYLESLKGP